MAKTNNPKKGKGKTTPELSDIHLEVTQEMKDKALEQQQTEKHETSKNEPEEVAPKVNFDGEKKAQKPVEQIQKNEVQSIDEEIIFITGAKILKDKPVLINFIERKVDNDESELDFKNKALPHKDFINAMDALKIHLAVITGQIKSNDVASPGKVAKSVVEPFKVTGFKIIGGEEKNGFVLSGGMHGKFGWIGLNAPMVRNVNDPEGGYIFIKELAKAIDKCQSEALAYRKGKHAPKDQIGMFDDTAEEQAK